MASIASLAIGSSGATGAANSAGDTGIAAPLHISSIATARMIIDYEIIEYIRVT